MQKKNGSKKSSVKIKDLQDSKNPKGGGKHISNVKYSNTRLK